MAHEAPHGWSDQSETQPISVRPPTPAETSTAGPAPTPRSTSERPGGSWRTVLHVLALLLVVAGVSLPLDGDRSLWATTTAWAAFATVAAVAQLAALGSHGSASVNAWWTGAIGAGSLVLFWTLLMLPVISTTAAFLVTLGTAAAVTAVLASPDRRI